MTSHEATIDRAYIVVRIAEAVAAYGVAAEIEADARDAAPSMSCPIFLTAQTSRREAEVAMNTWHSALAERDAFAAKARLS